ncbi:hypothetical protein DPMN_048936, partial [Dreissena polymorpha]
CIHIEKNAPPTGGHVFSPIWTIFKLVRHINTTNVLINFHDDWAKIVTSRVFTRFLYSHIRKTAPPTGNHVFQWTGTTFELNQHIIKTNILTNFELDRDLIGTKLLTKFHADLTINVASRVFTNKCKQTDGRRTKTGHKSSPEQSANVKLQLQHCIIRNLTPPQRLEIIKLLTNKDLGYHDVTMTPGCHLLEPPNGVLEMRWNVGRKNRQRVYSCIDNVVRLRVYTCIDTVVRQRINSCIDTVLVRQRSDRGQTEVRQTRQSFYTCIDNLLDTEVRLRSDRSDRSDLGFTPASTHQTDHTCIDISDRTEVRQRGLQLMHRHCIRQRSDRSQTEVRQRSDREFIHSDRGQTEVRQIRQRSDRGQTEVRQRSDRGFIHSDRGQTEVRLRSDRSDRSDRGQTDVRQRLKDVRQRGLHLHIHCIRLKSDRGVNTCINTELRLRSNRGQTEVRQRVNICIDTEVKQRTLKSNRGQTEVRQRLYICIDTSNRGFTSAQTLQSNIGQIEEGLKKHTHYSQTEVKQRVNSCIDTLHRHCIKQKVYICIDTPVKQRRVYTCTDTAAEGLKKHTHCNNIRTNLLTKFHEDRKINVAFRVLTKKNAPPPGSHVFQPTGITFEHVQDIIGLNLLTKFHEDRTVNVASRVLTRFYNSHIRKNAPPLGSHFFQANIIILELIQDIIETNLLTKFHEDWTLNVASREKCPAPCGHVFKATKTIFELIQDIIGTNLLTKFHDDRKINVTSRPRPRGGHVFQPTGIIFELIQDIIRMNLLTKFHEDRTINVASQVLTRLKNAPPLGCHVFHANITIFQVIQDIIETNLLTKFHEDWTLNVASREKCPASCGHVFKATKIIFELIQDIIGTNLLTKFHEDRTINVASRVKNAPPLGGHVFHANTNLLTIFHQDWTINVASRVLTRKNAPPTSGHVFQPTGIIFEFIQDIIGMNLLTTKNAPPLCSHFIQAKVTIVKHIQDISGTNPLSKFHDDQKINVASRVLTRFYYSHIRKNATPPGGHIFQPTGIIFELFYEDQTINVASRVFTRFYYSHIRKNAPPLGSHVFQANVIIFELIQDIIETNLLTKFHEDWTINVAYRELTRQILTPHNAQRTKDDGQKTLCSAVTVAATDPQRQMRKKKQMTDEEDTTTRL